MDQRLFRVFSHRPHRLTRNEVPDLAKAIVAFIRGRARVERLVVQDVACIRIFNLAAGLDVNVRGDDWVKVIPYLKDGSWDTSLFPVPEPVVLHVNTYYDPSVVDVNDRPLFERVLNVLDKLFTIEFPTSNL